MDTSNDKDGDGSEYPTERGVKRLPTARDSSEPSTSKIIHFEVRPSSPSSRLRESLFNFGKRIQAPTPYSVATSPCYFKSSLGSYFEVS